MGKKTLLDFADICALASSGELVAEDGNLNLNRNLDLDQSLSGPNWPELRNIYSAAGENDGVWQ